MVLISDELNKKLSLFSKLYEETEEAIKQAELITLEGLNFPAVNELRYATAHLSRFFSATSENIALQEIDKAISHINRAKYDAYDACILYFLDICADFNKIYDTIPIATIYSEYIEDTKTLNRIIKEIGSENRNQENFFETKQKQFIVLKQIYENWEACRSELNKIVLKERKSDRNSLIMIALAIITVMVTIIIAII